MRLFKDKKKIVCVLIIAIIVEVVFYNYRFWESLTFHEIVPRTMNIGEGLTAEDDLYRVDSNEDSYIELLGLDVPVKNIQVSLFPRTYSFDGNCIKIKLNVTDAGNQTYLALPETEILSGIPESQYIRIHLVGGTEKIRIDLINAKGQYIDLSGVHVNVLRPFMLHIYRPVCALLLGLIIIAFFPTSDLYSIPLNLTEKRQIIFTIGSVLIHILLFGVIGYIFYDKNWINTDWKEFLQYNYLAEALRDGHCYLNFTPPEILSTINNPYDNNLRNQILNQAGEQIITDFAYYNGRYYSYFGVIPVIMFYLPYLLLTGKPLSTGALLIGIVFLFIIASFCMVYRLFEKYYSKVSLGTYLLLTSVFIAGSEITYCVQMPTIYSVPLALGLTLDLLGISFWLSAAQPDGSVKKSCLIAGAACIALTVGCRPQLAIVTLFAFPIFWKEIKERKFFSAKGMGNTLSVILPFLVIDTALLYYNIVRFGSPLNFGATYNLTGFDMTHRGFILDRFVLGIWEYLFQPFNIKSSFPYFTIVAGHMDLQSDYQGQLINEPLMGGFFAFNLIAIFIFSLPNIKQELKKKGVLGFLILSLVSGLVIVGLDIQMVGMTLRYLTDFSVFLILSAIIVIGALLEKYTDNKPFYKSLLSLTIMLSFLCIATNYITLIANGRYNHLISSNPWIFYRIKYEICSLLSIR